MSRPAANVTAFTTFLLLALALPTRARSDERAPISAPASTPAPAPTSSVAVPAEAPAARREEALSHFELGLAHFDRSEWSAALAEFLEARELYPSRSATKNAAICLRKENRFDEALDMFEALVRDYPDLSGTDRQLAETEITQLRESVGTLAVSGAEDGALVVVDGKTRGVTPLPAPLRVSVGSHIVRVVKAGFSPFERRIEIASGAPAAVDARLAALVRSGRLRVVEQSGKVLDVVIDGVVVGKTPWEGSVAPGTHSVLLRGEGDLGTQPVVAPISVDAETPITLVAESLDATARIEPTPGGSLVAVDAVSVGRGVWEGRLRSGPHRIEVTSEGFLPSTRDVAIPAHERELFAISLDRDPTSPLWGRKARPRFSLELVGALTLAPSLGGEVSSACSSPCSASVPAGGMGVLRAAYPLVPGLELGVEGGYLALRRALDNRAAQIVGPALRVSDAGIVGDTLTLGGLLLGGTVSYRRGESWPVTLRVGVGAYLSTLTDDRNGSFVTSAQGVPANAPFSVGVSESHPATFLYAAPEVRVGRRLGDHLEVSVGLELLVLAALSQARWADQTPVLAAPPGTAGDGLGGFGAQTLTGQVLLVVSPGLAARYEF